MPRERHFSEERAGVRKLDRDRRKGTVEETGVILVKAGLYVRDGRGHGDVRRTNVRSTILGFEVLIDHGADEVIEAEIVLLMSGFI